MTRIEFDVHGYASWPAKAIAIDEHSNNIARYQHFISREGDARISNSKRASYPREWSGWWPTEPRMRASLPRTPEGLRRSSVSSRTSKARLSSAKKKKKIRIFE